MKTIVIGDFPVKDLKNMNSLLSFLSKIDYKIYELRGKKPNEVNLAEFEGYDIILALPEPSSYGIDLLKYLKEKTGLIMIGMMWHPIDCYMYNQDVYFGSVHPYFQIFDSMLVYSHYEADIFRNLYEKVYRAIGTGVNIDSIGMRNEQNRENKIASCARFNWNNAYANMCVAKYFSKKLEYYEFRSSNCNESDTLKMQDLYKRLGYVPKPVSFKCFYKLVIEDLSKFKIAINMENRHGNGAFLVDCALAGVPAVCSHTLETSWLFEDLIVEPFDVDGAIKKAIRLLCDEEFYVNVVKKAQERVMFNDVSSTTKRYLSLIEELKNGQK